MGGCRDRRRRGVGRTGRPSRPDHRGAPPAAPGRRDPHHGCRRVRGLGRARLPVPAARARSSGPPRARWATATRPRSPRRSSTASGGSWRCIGDGGMGMTLAEVETAVREDAHVVAIVFDNERYGMIRDHQELAGSDAAPATDLGPLDFAAAARACGARGVRVDTDAAFEGALRTALAASGPTVIQLVARPALAPRRPPRDRGRRRVTRPTLHLVPEARWDAWDPATPYLPAALRGGRVRPLHGRRRGDAQDGQPLLPRGPAAVPAAHRGPRRDGQPVAVRRPGLAVPAHLRADRARGRSPRSAASSATPTGRSPPSSRADRRDPGPLAQDPATEGCVRRLLERGREALED